MQYPADHPLWKLLRLVVVGTFTTVALVVLLAFGYQNGWTSADWKTVVGSVGTTLVSVGAFDKIKAMLCAKDDNSQQ